MSHCQRGEEVILGQEAHSYRYEAGGARGARLDPAAGDPNRADGTLDLAEVEAAIKPDDPHFARTRLLALENTIGGRVLPRNYLEEAMGLAKRRALATHLDGARVFNAATQLGMKVQDLCAGFDSVSACLSKGLGAPAGTVLLGKKRIHRRKQSGRAKSSAAACGRPASSPLPGLYALENNVERLAEDHRNAERLAARAARARSSGRAATPTWSLSEDPGRTGRAPWRAPGSPAAFAVLPRSADAAGDAPGRGHGRHRPRGGGLRELLQGLGFLLFEGEAQAGERLVDAPGARSSGMPLPRRPSMIGRRRRRRRRAGRARAPLARTSSVAVVEKHGEPVDRSFQLVLALRH